MDWAHGTGLANARQAETRAATRQVVTSPKEAPGRLRQVSRWERGARARRKTLQSQHKSKKPQAGTGEARGSTARLLRAASAAARGAGRRWRRGACAPSTSVPQAAGARCKPARRQSPSGRRCIEEDNRALSALQTNEREDRWSARLGAFAARYAPRGERLFCGAEHPQGHAGCERSRSNSASRNLLHGRHSTGLEAAPHLPAPLASP